MTRYLLLTLLLATLVPIQAKAAGPVKICFVDTGRSVTAQALTQFPRTTSTHQEIMDAWRQPKAVYEKAFEQIDHMVPLALANAAKQ